MLYVLGEPQLQTGQLADAADTFAQALATVHDVRDQVGEAHILRGVGVTALRQGQHDRARDALEKALELAETVRDPLAAARVQLALAELALATLTRRSPLPGVRQKSPGTWAHPSSRLAR